MTNRNNIKIRFTDKQGKTPKGEQKFSRRFLQELRRSGSRILRGIISSDNFLSTDQIRLDDIHDELGRSDAFVFMPEDGVDMALKLISTFVGVQTHDDNMFLNTADGRRQKPVVVINTNGQWNEFLKVIEETAYINPDHKKTIIHNIVDGHKDPHTLADEVIAGIGLHLEEPVDPIKPHEMSNEEREHMKQGTGDYRPDMAEPDYKVCVFCSASKIFKKHEGDNSNLAYQLGLGLAKAGYGVVSGAGRTGMMGEVVRGAVDAGGWTAGSNTPHIRKIEGLPNGLATYIDENDIYVRMRTMIEGSNAFVVAPGGAGSIQEFLTLLHLKEHHASLMQGKPVVIFSPPMPDNPKKHYWDALVKYAEKQGKRHLFHVAHTEEEALAFIRDGIERSHPASRSWKSMVKDKLDQQYTVPTEEVEPSLAL